ncbi:reverse transcriptase domain-containing protein [Tanacetum coccineum]
MILVDGGSSSEIMYEHYFRDLNVNIRSRLRRCRAPMVGFSGETYHPMGVIDLRVTMGRVGRSKMVLMEFAIIKCRSPYDVIIGRTGMRSLGAVGSTIHSMIKFPTNQGIVTIETSREALWECRQLERVQGSWKEVQWHQREEQISKIREKVILRTKTAPNEDLIQVQYHWKNMGQGRHIGSIHHQP